MRLSGMKRIGVTALCLALFIVALSALFHVPFVFGLLIAFAWPVLGMIITADDYVKGGWGNLDGTAKPPWPLFFLLFTLAIAVGAMIVLFPQVRTYSF